MIHPAQNGKAGAVAAVHPSQNVSDPPGVEQAPTGRCHLSGWNWGTPIPPRPREWDSKMPECGREDGGGVVVQRLAVMARTWRRSARGGLSKSKSTDAEGRADEGVGLQRWCAPRSATTSPPLASRRTEPESVVRRKAHATFGAGERLQSPTYCYRSSSSSFARTGQDETAGQGASQSARCA